MSEEDEEEFVDEDEEEFVPTEWDDLD